MLMCSISMFDSSKQLVISVTQLKVNVSKRVKIMRFVCDGIVGEMNIVMDGQVLEEVEFSGT